MKKYLLIGALLLAGCGEDTSVDPAMKPYLDRFVADAARYNVQVSAETINLHFREDVRLMNGGFEFGEANGNSVEIVKDYWNSGDDARKEAILYHELGHAVLHQKHRGTFTPGTGPSSVMFFNIDLVTEHWTDNREAYLKELFEFKE